MTQLIGILGGTFNPVHNGHIALANAIYKTCNLQKVLLIPCYQAPLKTLPTTNSQDRLNMLRLASKKFDYLEIDDYEIKNPTVSYTITTLHYLQQKTGTSPLVLIMGYDLFYNFTMWHKWQEILELSHIVVAQRLNHQITPLPTHILTLLKQRQIIDPQELHHKKSGLIYYNKFNLPPIASSTIRDLIKKQCKTDDLLSYEVQQYIKTQQLYIRETK